MKNLILKQTQYYRKTILSQLVVRNIVHQVPLSMVLILIHLVYMIFLFGLKKKDFHALFFGIYSSLKKRVDAISSGNENSVYGWWDIDSVVLNGTKQEGGNGHIISTGDKVVVTLDCDQQQIQLYHIRENRQVELPIDVNKCPFPWKIIVKLTANGDCVRIR